MKQIMIDIETMGKTPYSAIISIGAAQFDISTGQIGKKLYLNIDLQSCFDSGLHADASTIMWWMQQSDEARQSLSNKKLGILPAMHAFNDYIHDCGEDSEIWANSPGFDLNLLQDAMGKLNIECPWKFWQERDCRTLDSLMPYIRKTIVNDLPHDALSDCLYQIKYISQIYKTINK